MILAFTAIAFVEKKYDQKTCQEIDIYIHNKGNDYFLNKDEVYSLITENESGMVIGASYDKIDLRTIENRINENVYVENAQAYIDLNGIMTVDVFMKEPIARILNSSGKDFYLCKNNELIPTSRLFTSRVLLVNGSYFRNRKLSQLTSDKTFVEIMNMIHYINNDPFWRAQIAMMTVDDNGDLRLLPQVTKQEIEFGKAENITG